MPATLPERAAGWQSSRLSRSFPIPRTVMSAALLTIEPANQGARANAYSMRHGPAAFAEAAARDHQHERGSKRTAKLLP